jgi:hypothetical protein
MWFEEAFRGVHIDCHMPEFNEKILCDIDPKKIIKTVKDSNCNVFYIFTKGHHGNSYYNTKVGHKHINIKDRDLLYEFLDECKKAEIKAMAYYSIGFDNNAAKNNPDWLQRTNNGEPIYAIEYWPSICLNSPYKEYVMSQISEIISYSPDGIFLDCVF